MQKYRVKIPFCCRKCVLSVSRRQHWTGAPTGLSNDRNHHNHQAAPLICTWRPGRGWRRLWCSNMMTVTSKRPTPARQPGPGAALPWLSAVHLTFISFKCSQWTIKIMRPSPLNIKPNWKGQTDWHFVVSGFSYFILDLTLEKFSSQNSQYYYQALHSFSLSCLIRPGSKGRLLYINTGMALVTLLTSHTPITGGPFDEPVPENCFSNLTSERREEPSPAAISDQERWHNPHCAPRVPRPGHWPTNWYYRHRDDCFLSPITGWQKYCLSVTSIASVRDLFLSKTSKHHHIIRDYYPRASRQKFPEPNRNGRTLTERLGGTIQIL